MPTRQGRGSAFSLAMQALITAANSSAVREGIYEASDFPLKDYL